MTNDYLPIDCDQHSVLELLAMRRTPVVVHAARADGGELRLSGRVTDVLTRAGAEYLEISGAAGQASQVRLDRLLAIYDSAHRPVWRQKNDRA